MKVLWITNSHFPIVSDELKLKSTLKGWVFSAANGLINEHSHIHLAVASIYSGKEFKQINTDRITHYLLPEKVRRDASNRKNDIFWKKIKKEFNPDLVHIHGSEYPYSYSFIRACGSENVVVSIQGLVSVIERYYFGNIKTADLFKSITLRDIVRLDTIFSKRRNMRKRGKIEKLLLQNISHVIGRTSWDRNHVWAINSDANYHFCNETLRPSFYQNQWILENCEKYSITISQAYYPLKGFHQLLKALPIVLKHYPKTKVYVAGNNEFTNKGIRLNGYGNYINSLIRKLKLSDHIIFVGLLSENEMCQRLINSHLSLCSSAIENSPNSVGEAQLLGLPCIASYVGGMADMITHGETGLLYRFDEVEMLAANICNLFGDNQLALRISKNAKINAAGRHNEKQNSADLFGIYSEMVDG